MEEMPSTRSKPSYQLICVGNVDNPSLNVKQTAPGDSGGPLWWKDEATQQIFQVRFFA